MEVAHKSKKLERPSVCLPTLGGTQSTRTITLVLIIFELHPFELFK